MRYGRRPVLKRSITRPDCGLIDHDRVAEEVRRVDQAAVRRKRDIAREIAGLHFARQFQFALRVGEFVDHAARSASGVNRLPVRRKCQSQPGVRQRQLGTIDYADRRLWRQRSTPVRGHRGRPPTTWESRARRHSARRPETRPPSLRKPLGDGHSAADAERFGGHFQSRARPAGACIRCDPLYSRCPSTCSSGSCRLAAISRGVR